jgi:hypothetical protein
VLSKDEIKKKLQEDPNFEPDENATEKDWIVFDEVVDEMKKNGELPEEEIEEEEVQPNDNLGTL